VALLALFRSGARRLVVPAALALVVAVGGGATQLHVDDGLAAARRTATDHPAPMQTCRVLGDVRYCAFDDFTPWISDWDAVLRSVRRAVPAKATHPASGPVLTVRQRVLAVGRPAADDVVSAEDIQRRATIDRRADAAAGTPEAISAGTAWGDSRAAAVFAAAVAYRLITGRAWLGGPAVCGARGALLVWLVGQGSARTAEGLRKLDAASWGGLAFGDGGSDGWIDVPDPDAAAGLALLHRPSSQARAAVLAHWDELSAATTDADRFAALVGVPATPQPPVRERAACDR
jgi:hypothetical protein